MRRRSSIPLAWLPAVSALSAAVFAAVPAAAAEPLAPCRLPGLEHEALCGRLTRPLDPAAAAGPTIELHFAVLPALARRKLPDPVFFFAGGPGQSAIELAGTVSRLLARLANRRDIVLIDQRGSGRSAPLACDDDGARQPLAERLEPARQAAALAACRERLAALPHGDLRRYTTAIAAEDADAVRRHLGAERINAVGASYGTRVVLELQRRFPQTVRRAVLDGVVPPDLSLPAAAAADGQAAFDALVAGCAAEPRCAASFPRLREGWRQVLAGLPREVVIAHPTTGRDERVRLTPDAAGTLLRAPLYAPALAAGLPQAIAEAAAGRFGPLVGLASALDGGAVGRIATGMHFSVVCAEDRPAADAAMPAPDIGHGLAALYARVCADWPRGAVPPAFYRVAPAPAATLLLSGGADPATPPRHAERTARALGALARHVVVPHAGHGLLALPCLRDAVFRFVDAASDAEALAVDTGCARGVPRPPAQLPPATP